MNISLFKKFHVVLFLSVVMFDTASLIAHQEEQRLTVANANAKELERLFGQKTNPSEVIDKLKDLANENSKYYEGWDRDRKKSLIDNARQALEYQTEKIVRDNKPLSLTDVFIRGVAGKNWMALENLRPESFEKAIAYVGLYKGSEVLGEHISASIESSLGDFLDSALGGIFEKVSGTAVIAYRGVRNFLTGLSGTPFSGRDIKLWKDTLNRMLSDLERTGKNSGIMDARSRDKVFRDFDVDESFDPIWLGQRDSYCKQIEYLISVMDNHKKYYSNGSDQDVIFYTDQVEDLLNDIKDNIIGKSKTQKDIASTAVQAALALRRSTLDLYFTNLLTLVAPRAAQKDIADISRPQGGRRNAIMDDF